MSGNGTAIVSSPVTYNFVSASVFESESVITVSFTTRTTTRTSFPRTRPLRTYTSGAQLRFADDLTPVKQVHHQYFDHHKIERLAALDVARRWRTPRARRVRRAPVGTGTPRPMDNFLSSTLVGILRLESFRRAGWGFCP